MGENKRIDGRQRLVNATLDCPCRIRIPRFVGTKNYQYRRRRPQLGEVSFWQQGRIDE